MAEFKAENKEAIDIAPPKDKELDIPKFEPEKEAEREKGGEVSPQEVMLNTMLVEACLVGIGNLFYTMTQVEEARFSENEVEVLKVAWGPLLPKLSPIMLATLATIGVFAPKATVVVIKMRERSKRHATGATGQASAVELAKEQAKQAA